MNVRFILLSSNLIQNSTTNLPCKAAYSQLRNYLIKNISSSCLFKPNHQFQKRFICLSVIKLNNNSKAEQSNPKILSSSLVESDGKQHQNQVSTHLSPGKKGFSLFPSEILLLIRPIWISTYSFYSNWLSIFFFNLRHFINI
jgi:hypothetical protein